MGQYSRNFRKTKFLTVADVCRLHDQLLKIYGGAAGIRDKALLESAIAQPSLIIFDKYIHDTIFDKAAAYCFHLIKNHPFVDGNKRTGLLVALTFLESNGFAINYDFDSLYNLAIQIASSNIDKDSIATFLKEGSKNR